ncbi:MAG: hypothetical protein WCC25_18845 [Candidatus Korobacteraceae bacterium]
MSAQYSTEVLRQPADSRRRLLLCGASVVGMHFVVVLWHLVVLVRVQPNFPMLGGLGLILINLLPIAGVVAFAKGATRLAASLIVIPLGVALVIGGYSHFLSPGSDNVLRMPPHGLTLEMQISAALLAVLEALGCWLGVKMLSRHDA